jgi:hypothetical protein
MPSDITSLQRLRCYQLPTGYTDADCYLQQRWETIQLLAIFQKYFPAKLPPAWAADQDKLLPQNEEPYSEAELACIRLINSELFPFALDHLLDCADEGERLSTIPLYAYGIDQWERAFSDFEPGWQILLLLADPVDEVGVEELSVEVRAALAQATRTETVSLSRMDELCQSEEEPLRALPIALRMINHSTENAFLDPTDEMPCEDMFWDLEDVALLIQHWKEADAMMKQTDVLTEWLAADPQHVKKAVDLWNRSVNL